MSIFAVNESLLGEFDRSFTSVDNHFDGKLGRFDPTLYKDGVEHKENSSQQTELTSASVDNTPPLCALERLTPFYGLKRPTRTAGCWQRTLPARLNTLSRRTGFVTQKSSRKSG